MRKRQPKTPSWFGPNVKPTRQRKPKPRLEKFEQADGVELLTKIGAKVYVSGTRRPGSRCPKCGEFVRGHQGTCQTEGIPDVEAFLPFGNDTAGPCGVRRLLKWEVKREAIGVLSPAQVEYRVMCIEAGVHYVTGPLNALIAFLIHFKYLKPENVAHYRAPQKEGAA